MLYRLCSAQRKSWENASAIKKGNKPAQCLACMWKDTECAPGAGEVRCVSSHDSLNEFPCIICQELTATSLSLLVTWDYCQVILCSVDGCGAVGAFLARDHKREAGSCSSDPRLLPASVTAPQQRGLLTVGPSEGHRRCFSTHFFLTDALGTLWRMQRLNCLLAEKVKRETKKRHLWVVFIPPGV